MYLIQLGPVVYEPRGGGGFSLVEAMREVRGVFGARVLRLDGAPVVAEAGSSYRVVYVGGRRPREIRRRMTRWAEPRTWGTVDFYA